MALPLAVGITVGALNFINNVSSSNSEAEAAALNAQYLRTQLDSLSLRRDFQIRDIEAKYAGVAGSTGASSGEEVGYVSGGSALTTYKSQIQKFQGREIAGSLLNEMNQRQAIQHKINNQEAVMDNAESGIRFLSDTANAVASGVSAYGSLGGKFGKGGGGGGGETPDAEFKFTSPSSTEFNAIDKPARGWRNMRLLKSHEISFDESMINFTNYHGGF